MAKTAERAAHDGQLSANGVLAAIRQAADGLRRVGELAGHAATAAEILERLEKTGARASGDAAAAVRAAWVEAAEQARAQYDVTTGPLRAVELGLAPIASRDLLRAFDALDRLVGGEQEGTTS
jgi:hypothetical protein